MYSCSQTSLARSGGEIRRKYGLNLVQDAKFTGRARFHGRICSKLAGERHNDSNPAFSSKKPSKVTRINVHNVSNSSSRLVKQTPSNFNPREDSGIAEDALFTTESETSLEESFRSSFSSNSPDIALAEQLSANLAEQGLAELGVSAAGEQSSHSKAANGEFVRERLSASSDWARRGENNDRNLKSANREFAWDSRIFLGTRDSHLLTASPSIKQLTQTLFDTFMRNEDIGVNLQGVGDQQYECLRLLRALNERNHTVRVIPAYIQWMRGQEWFVPKTSTYNQIMIQAARRGLVDTCVSFIQELEDNGLSPDSLSFACLIVSLTVSEKYDLALDLFVRRTGLGDSHPGEVMKSMLHAGRSGPISWINSVVRVAQSAGVLLDVPAYAVLVQIFSNRGLYTTVEELYCQMVLSRKLKPVKSTQVLYFASQRQLNRNGAPREVWTHLRALLAVPSSTSSDVPSESPEIIQNLEAELGSRGRNALEGRSEEVDATDSEIQLILYAFSEQIAVSAVQERLENKDLASGLKLLRLMEPERQRSASYIYSMLTSALCKEGRIREAEELLMELRALPVVGFDNRLATFNSLFNAYAKSGAIPEFHNLFRTLQVDGVTPNIVTFTAKMNLCLFQGQSSVAAAHEVYQETVASGITPDFPFFMAYCNVLSQANAHLHIVGLQEKVLRAGLSLENNPAISCSLAKAALEVEAPEMALDIIHKAGLREFSLWSDLMQLVIREKGSESEMYYKVLRAAKEKQPEILASLVRFVNNQDTTIKQKVAIKENTESSGQSLLNNFEALTESRRERNSRNENSLKVFPKNYPEKGSLVPNDVSVSGDKYWNNWGFEKVSLRPRIAVISQIAEKEELSSLEKERKAPEKKQNMGDLTAEVAENVGESVAKFAEELMRLENARKDGNGQKVAQNPAEGQNMLRAIDSKWEEIEGTSDDFELKVKKTEVLDVEENVKESRDNEIEVDISTIEGKTDESTDVLIVSEKLEIPESRADSNLVEMEQEGEDISVFARKTEENTNTLPTLHNFEVQESRSDMNLMGMEQEGGFSGIEGKLEELAETLPISENLVVQKSLNETNVVDKEQKEDGLVEESAEISENLEIHESRMDKELVELEVKSSEASVIGAQRDQLSSSVNSTEKALDQDIAEAMLTSLEARAESGEESFVGTPLHDRDILGIEVDTIGAEKVLEGTVIEDEQVNICGRIVEEDMEGEAKSEGFPFIFLEEPGDSTEEESVSEDNDLKEDAPQSLESFDVNEHSENTSAEYQDLDQSKFGTNSPESEEITHSSTPPSSNLADNGNEVALPPGEDFIGGSENDERQLAQENVGDINSLQDILWLPPDFNHCDSKHAVSAELAGFLGPSESSNELALSPELSETWENLKSSLTQGTQPDLDSWQAVIEGFASSGNLARVSALMTAMEQRVHGSVVPLHLYHCQLSLMIEAGHHEGMQKVLETMAERGTLPTKETVQLLFTPLSIEEASRKYVTPSTLVSWLANRGHPMRSRVLEWAAQILSEPSFNPTEDSEKLPSSEAAHYLNPQLTTLNEPFLGFRAGFQMAREIRREGGEPGAATCRSLVLAAALYGPIEARQVACAMGNSRWLNCRAGFRAAIEVSVAEEGVHVAQNLLYEMRSHGIQPGPPEFSLLISAAAATTTAGAVGGADILITLLEEAQEEKVALNEEVYGQILEALVECKQYLKAVSWLRRQLGAHPSTPPQASLLLGLFSGLRKKRLWRPLLDIFSLMRVFKDLRTPDSFFVVMETLLNCSQPGLCIELAAEMRYSGVNVDSRHLDLLCRAYHRLGMLQQLAKTKPILEAVIEEEKAVLAIREGM